MSVLIDLGNSFLKLAIVDEKNKIINVKKIKLEDHKKDNIKTEIVNHLADIKTTNKKIIISSVNNKWNDFVKNIFISDDLKWLNFNDFTKLNFPNKSETGIDLLCLGAAVLNQKNTLIVSFGTATTFTLWNDNNLLGAIISPGAWTAFKGLTKSASLIKDTMKINFKTKLGVIGSDTNSAINIGTFKAHALMSEAIIKDIQSKHSISNIIFTGGGLDNIKPYLKGDYKINENLIFEGMLNL